MQQYGFMLRIHSKPDRNSRKLTVETGSWVPSSVNLPPPPKRPPRGFPKSKPPKPPKPPEPDPELELELELELEDPVLTLLEDGLLPPPPKRFRSPAKN